MVCVGKGDSDPDVAANVVARIEAVTRHGDTFSGCPRRLRAGARASRGGRSIAVVGDEPRAEIKLETYKGDITVRTSERSVLMATLPTPGDGRAPPAPSTPPRAPFPTWAPGPAHSPLDRGINCAGRAGLTAMSV